MCLVSTYIFNFWAKSHSQGTLRCVWLSPGTGQGLAEYRPSLAPHRLGKKVNDIYFSLCAISNWINKYLFNKQRSIMTQRCSVFTVVTIDDQICIYRVDASETSIFDCKHQIIDDKFQNLNAGLKH